jgi:hypothetical protein
MVANTSSVGFYHQSSGKEEAKRKKEIRGGKKFSTGLFDLQVIWTPGHSPGHEHPFSGLGQRIEELYCHYGNAGAYSNAKCRGQSGENA